MVSNKHNIDYILRRGVAEIIVEAELRKLLESGVPLRLKMGFDPTRPHLHLGYAVALRKLRQFQELGHQVILIVGDWTAQIGDPSGQAQTRTMLSAEEVRANAQTYMTQFFRIVDPQKTQVMWQSEWFGKFTLADVIDLTRRFTVAQMLAREDVANRYKEGRPIAVTEFIYPLLQAYDSLAIQSDVEFGGTDQMFNCLVGRELQEMMGQKPQQVFLMPLLVGTDGRKMSQSFGNYIAFEEPPNDMYGKIMSIPDAIMMDYYELLTDVPDEELAEMRRKLAEGSVNPMEHKLRLAKEITSQFWGQEKAVEAEEHFTRVVREREMPEDIDKFYIDGISPSRSTGSVYSSTGILVDIGLAPSRSAANRLLAQGAVEIDGRKLGAQDKEIELLPGSVIKVGKRRFVRIVDSDKES